MTTTSVVRSRVNEGKAPSSVPSVSCQYELEAMPCMLHLDVGKFAQQIVDGAAARTKGEKC
jgi:hypothetical protein